MLCRQHPPSPVFSSIFWMCPAPSAIHEEPMCCECQAKFRGHLPVPRTQAALPYWVPQTLRPQKQIQKTIRVCIPKVIKTCLCRCHCFEGRLPMPKYQATMPYWVPQVLRSHKKVVERQQSSKGTQASIFWFEVGTFSYCQEHQQKCQLYNQGLQRKSSSPEESVTATIFSDHIIHTQDSSHVIYHQVILSWSRVAVNAGESLL
ncbi:uncharacterized protein C16orf95 homolog isoform 3-T3 [Hipposideros larvatus]